MSEEEKKMPLVVEGEGGLVKVRIEIEGSDREQDRALFESVVSLVIILVQGLREFGDHYALQVGQILMNSVRMIRGVYTMFQTKGALKQ